MAQSGDNPSSPEIVGPRPEQQWGEDGLGDPSYEDFGAPAEVIGSASPYLGTSLEHRVDRDPIPPAVVPVD